MTKTKKITSILLALTTAFTTYASGFAAATVSADSGEKELMNHTSEALAYSQFTSYSLPAYSSENDLRNRFVSIAAGYVGIHESSSQFRTDIIDAYNNMKPADMYKMTYSDAWCAAFYSLCALRSGFTDIFPLGVGCTTLMREYKSRGQFSYRGEYTPRSGDIIFYNWDQASSSSDHVGIVESVSGDTITTIEGNYSDSVKRRQISMSSGYIVGYGRPDYTSASYGTSVPGEVWTEEEDFYAYIVQTSIWRHVQVTSTGNDADNVELSYANNDLYEGQLFHFIKTDDNDYYVMSCLNDKVLDAHGAGTANTTNLEVYPFHGGDNQRWVLYMQNDGTFVIKARYTDLVVDVAGNCSTGGTNLNLYEFNDTSAQHFSIYIVAKRSTELKAGYYNITKANSGMKLSMCGSSLQLASPSRNDDSTIFHITEQECGTYAIFSRDNTRGITIDKYEPGRAMIVSSEKASILVLYKFQDEYGGKYFFRPVDSNLVFDVTGNYDTESTPVGLWMMNNTNAQKFDFTRIG